VRLLQIVRVALRVAFSQLFGDRENGPRRVRDALQDLGGTFIKFGQMLSSQPDVLAPEYCSALFDLMDRIEPFPFDQAEKIFQEELGCQTADIFDSIEREPIATASIGQVHVAFLAGRKVAVKIQRPEATRDFGYDLAMMERMVCFIKKTRFKSLYWLIEPTSEFIAWTKEELDFRIEARYGERLGKCAADNPRACIPVIHSKWTTRRILVMDFLEGVTVLNYLRALESGDRETLDKVADLCFDPQRFALNITRTFLSDAFEHGMFHADLHPANIVIMEGSVVGYLDFGITGALSAYSKRHLISLTLAYSRGDLDALARSFFRITASRSNSNPREFRSGLERLSKEWYGNPGEGPRLRLSITRMMFGLLVLSRKTNLLPDREAVKYIRSAISVDSQVQRFAPGFDMGRRLEDICNAQLQIHSQHEAENVLWNGALRVAEYLQQIDSGELASRLETSVMEAASERALRRKTVGLAVAFFAVSLLVAMSGVPFQFGLNLITAELLFLAATGGLLLQTFRR